MADLSAARGLRTAETHISLLVFTEGRVYKLRKPIRFGFVDFTSRKNREEDCRREVDLNRRLSPDVYLGVADIVMDGVPIDHLVVMRALPEAQQLQQLVLSGTSVDPYLDAAARTLAGFHATAKRSAEISACATPAAVRCRWEDDFAEMERFVGKTISAPIESEIRRLVEHWIDTHSDLLEERIAGTYICDGHGDLQASDVFCLEDGVRILDCLEFSDALRWGDVCADVAFLAMDLERLGDPAAAKTFTESYERHTGDPLPRTLLDFHIAHRAYIRALVDCLRAEQGVEDAANSARELHLRARRHLLRSRKCLVMVGGLPGAGKSTLASQLGEELGWIVLSSDVIRRGSALGPSRYTPDEMAAVYAELSRLARDHLRHGHSVVIDASWINADERVQATQVASQMDAELIEIQCTCPTEVAAGRIRRRLQGGTSESEATVSVRAKMAARMDPWLSSTRIDTSRSLSKSVEEAFSAIAQR